MPSLSPKIYYASRFVSPIKSSTLSLSGRNSNTGADVNEVNASVSQPSFVALAAIIGFREFLRVFLLCPKAVLTMFLNAFSSQPRDVRLFLVSLITADCTFGGGANAPEPTVNKYSMSYQAWSRTDRIPYVLEPGFSAMRSATSFCIMQTV